ncbi:NADH dehydrogenase [ubiquinone] 1 beta subcomplex subunit 2, mitochondrial [Manacus candei]|nr:NADH dehydrogenase [ubiquinone] 1 beta subcomplex subunit 2, mitochondrial [Manacus candei]
MSPPRAVPAPEGGGGSNGRGCCWALRVTLGADMVVAALGRAAAARLLRAGVAAPGRRRAGGGGVHIAPRYRQVPELTRAQVIRSELLSGLMWFWILWHFWHSSDMVLGHFPYPDASAWTDEELGIPPDDEE